MEVLGFTGAQTLIFLYRCKCIVLSYSFTLRRETRRWKTQIFSHCALSWTIFSSIKVFVSVHTVSANVWNTIYIDTICSIKNFNFPLSCFFSPQNKYIFLLTLWRRKLYEKTYKTPLLGLHIVNGRSRFNEKRSILL